MDRKGIRALSAAVIFDGFRVALRPGRFTRRIGLAQEWLFDPHSNLDVFAAVLGHSGDHYRRLAHRLRGPLRIAEVRHLRAVLFARAIPVRKKKGESRWRTPTLT